MGAILKRYWLFFLLVGITVMSFLLRAIPNWNTVFTSHGVQFIDYDSIYYRRLIEVDWVNFPKFLTYDYYALPGGAPVFYTPIISWMAILIGYVIHLAAMPDLETVLAVAVLIPPVLGALITVPVYYIGKLTFNSQYVGLMGALLVAVIPGEFYGRTLLGYVDHHALEAFFVTLTIMFLILAQKTGKERYSYLAGIALGLYHLSWNFSWVFTIILLAWGVLDSLLTRLRGEESTFIKSVMLPDCFFISALIFLPYIPYSDHQVMYLAVLVGALVVSSALPTLAHLLSKRVFAATIMVGFIIAGTLGLYHLSQNGWYYSPMIQEAQPLLLAWYVAVWQYLLCLPFAIYGFIVGRKAWQSSSLFFFWALSMFGLNCFQVRFGYYSTIPIGILTAYGIEFLAKHIWQKDAVKTAFGMGFLTVVVIGMMPQTVLIAMAPHVAVDPTNGWNEVCVWLKENSPEPYFDGAYLISTTATETLPSPSYSVLSWWGNGHYIVTYARRVPLVSNTQFGNDAIVAKFLTAQTEDEAERAIDGLNVRYVIIDKFMLDPTQFATMVCAATGSVDGYEQLPPDSEVSRLYTGTGNVHWQLVHENKDGVKVFVRG